MAGWDLFRKLTSRVANFLAHTLLSPGVTDLTGSYRLFTKAALEDIMKEVTSKGALVCLAGRWQVGLAVRKVLRNYITVSMFASNAHILPSRTWACQDCQFV